MSEGKEMMAVYPLDVLDLPLNLEETRPAKLPRVLLACCCMHVPISDAKQLKARLLATATAPVTTKTSGNSNGDTASGPHQEVVPLKIDVALIDAKMIPGAACLEAAAAKAIINHARGRLVTRNLHSELVFMLGANRRIRDCLTIFGMKDSIQNEISDRSACSDIVFAAFPQEGQEDEIQKALLELVNSVSTPNVEGPTSCQLCPMEDVGLHAATDRIRSYYSINEEELQISSLESCVLSRIAIGQEK